VAIARQLDAIREASGNVAHEPLSTFAIAAVDEMRNDQFRAGVNCSSSGIVTLAQYRRFLAVLARRRETQAIDFAHAGRGAATAIDK